MKSQNHNPPSNQAKDPPEIPLKNAKRWWFAKTSEPAERSASVTAALEQIKSAQDVHVLRRAQVIVLRLELGLAVEEISRVIGQSRTTVWRLEQEFGLVQAGRPLARSRWGGRRRQHLTVEEEKQILLEFEPKAGAGELVITQQIQAAYEAKVGQAVPASTVTRMLARQRWRKVEPEPKHPKDDPVAAEAFKKKSLARSWKRRGAVWLPPAPSAWRSRTRRGSVG